MKGTVINQQVSRPKIKGVADVVFCIDKSGSMTGCIEGLVNHIEKFIDGLKSNQQLSSLDLRLGLLAQDCIDFVRLDLTDNLAAFKNALRDILKRIINDEFTLPGLDWALDLSWREKCTRIVVLFTDEPLQGGHDAPFQLSKMRELQQKIQDLKVHLYFVGWKCDEYDSFTMVPKSIVELIEDHSIFSSYNFVNLLNTMGETLSGSLNDQDVMLKSVPKDIYGVKNRINVIDL